MKLTMPIHAELDIESLRTLASAALNVVQQVRSTMLAPTAKKATPVFTAPELAELCGVEVRKILYEAKKGVLPSGDADGSRRQWTLPDAMTWVKEFRKDTLRDPALAAGVVIAVANFKGGVTKTTTAMTLAQGLSLRGHKVLVIDTDPQGSLTTLFGILPDTDVEEDKTILPLCTGEEDSIIPAIQSTYWHGIDLVAAAPVLFNAEFILPSRQARNQNFEFWRILDLGLMEARGVIGL